MELNNLYQEKINEVYFKIEQAKKILSDITFEATIKKDFNIDEGPECDRWEATKRDNIIKVYIPDYPPRLVNAKDLYKHRWLRNMRYALSKLEDAPKYKKAFVWVVMYVPREDWDVDNRDVKPLIDGIRYSRLIKDDNIKCISYGIDGYVSNEPHTEVFIMPSEIIENHIGFTIKNLWKNQ